MKNLSTPDTTLEKGLFLQIWTSDVSDIHLALCAIYYADGGGHKRERLLYHS